MKSVFDGAYIPSQWIGIQTVSLVYIPSYNLFLKAMKGKTSSTTDNSQITSLKNRSEQNVTVKEKMDEYFPNMNL